MLWLCLASAALGAIGQTGATPPAVGGHALPHEACEAVEDAALVDEPLTLSVALLQADLRLRAALETGASQSAAQELLASESSGLSAGDAEAGAAAARPSAGDGTASPRAGAGAGAGTSAPKATAVAVSFHAEASAVSPRGGAEATSSGAAAVDAAGSSSGADVASSGAEAGAASSRSRVGAASSSAEAGAASSRNGAAASSSSSSSSSGSQSHAAETAESPPRLVYDDADLWDPGQQAWPTAGGCEGVAPWGDVRNFVRGRCPRVLRGHRVPVRLNLDSDRDGTNATGYNPSLVPLPAFLQERYPEGRWLAALRAGDEHFITSTCNHNDIHMGKAAREAMPPTPLLLGVSGRVPFWLAVAFGRRDETFRFGPRSYVVVLDAHYQVLDQATVTMRHGNGPWDDAAIQDLRLFALDGGKLLAGFQAYYLQMAEPAKDPELDWRKQEILALLHLDAPASGLRAWVDRREARYVRQCPELGLIAPGPKKNLGFFDVGGKTYALDWIYPTRVGEVDTGALDAHHWQEPTEHVAPLCYGYNGLPSGLANSPWDGLHGRNFWGLPVEVEPHNGTPLVWIEEISAWLAIGHVLRFVPRRGKLWSVRRYTQQFYTVSGGPGSDRPFALDRTSGEFCFESAQRPGSCESTQVATSLQRVGDRLQIGYGVMDCESYIVTVTVQEVLSMLEELH